MHLDRNRSLEIEISSGWNNITSAELHVRAATAGLRLQTSEAKVASGSLEIPRTSEAGVIRFGALEPNSIARLRVPFSLEHEVNDISLKFEISYITEKGTFFYATTPTMSIMLPLGVNVQDNFKHKALFSKFTISSATSSPLRLLGIRLEGSEAFDAEGGNTITSSIVVFPRQPASMLYKITRSASSISNPRHDSRKDPKSTLLLVLNYICLEEEIEHAVIKHLEGSLENGPVHPYMRLVVPAVIAELRSHLHSYDLERTAILSKVSTSALASVKWRDHFSGLGRTLDKGEDIATLIAETLQSWLQRTPNIPLIPISVNEDSIEKSRSITIPVDVPSVTVVHTADLKLLSKSSVESDTAIVASNQPISASLTIKWTTIWDTEPQSRDAKVTQDEELEFFYEVSGAADTWLIGGRRKGHFRIPSKTRTQNGNHKLSFPIVLIPLREGFLRFPNVDIKPSPLARMKVGSAAPEDDPSRLKQPTITCETNYKNSGETIRVISNAWKTTVSLDASGPQGGAWLLESERRGIDPGGAVLG